MFLKKFVRLALIGLGLCLVLAGLIAALYSDRIGVLTAPAAERYFSNLLKTDVSVEGLRVLPFKGALEFQGIAVTNPEGFKDAPAIECERMWVNADVRTLFSESPVIREIGFQGTKINLRHETGQGSNIGRLVDKVSGAESGGASRRNTFYIRHLISEDAKLAFSTNLIPVAKVGMRVITIDLSDISPENPVTSRQVARIFLRSALNEALSLNGLLRPVVQKVQEKFGGANSE